MQFYSLNFHTRLPWGNRKIKDLKENFFWALLCVNFLDDKSK